MTLTKTKLQLRDSSMSILDIGSGPALLLAHGWLCDSQTWSAQVDALSRDYRVIVPDMWGHGLSGAMPPSTTSLSDIASQHQELLDIMGVDRVCIVGHSMGAMWGAELAIIDPQRVSGLVIVASSLAAEPEPSKASFLAVVDQIAEQQGLPEEFASSLLWMFYSEKFRLQHPDRLRLHQHQLVNWPRDRIDDSVVPIGRMIFNRRDVTSEINALKIPMLTMAGSADQALSIDRVIRMAQSIGSPSISIEGAGHMLADEAPAPVTSYIRDLMETL